MSDVEEAEEPEEEVEEQEEEEPEEEEADQAEEEEEEQAEEEEEEQAEEKEDQVEGEQEQMEEEEQEEEQEQVEVQEEEQEQVEEKEEQETDTSSDSESESDSDSESESGSDSKSEEEEDHESAEIHIHISLKTKKEKKKKKKKKKEKKKHYSEVEVYDNPVNYKADFEVPIHDKPVSKKSKKKNVATAKISGIPELFHPTVLPFDDFNVERDVETLRNAMRGTGTEEQRIIDVISHRANAQRQEIEITYKTMYGKDLLEDLEKELSGDLSETVLALFKSPAFYDAWSLHKAMAGVGTKDKVLIEILCTRSNQQISDIKECYQTNYGKSLEKAIKKETSSYYQRLLVACCQGNRNEFNEEQTQYIISDGVGSVIDIAQARADAEKLYAAGEKKFGTDESAFIQVLVLRNLYHIATVCEEYEEIAGKDLIDSIDSEMSGNLASGLKAIVRYARCGPEYFSHALHKAMSGIGTDDSTVIRIIVSRSELDLGDIKDDYKERYGKTLSSAIESDTSGDYRKLLLALINS